MQDLQDLLAPQTRQDGRKALLRARSVLERAVEDMDARLWDYDHASSDSERAGVLNRTIHHLVSNVQLNLNIHRMADQQAALAKLAR